MNWLSFGLLLLCLGLSYATKVPGQIFNSNPAKNWVVLVAGSSGWWNYRHQADICHAYQILKARGIPESNIITMMYDDIAYNQENPYPGQIFNDYEQKDVYKGVVIDYKENEVTAEMFMKVMKGDPELAARGKKVLKSGPEDNVFLFFSDHGGDGLIAFPSGELYVNDLNDTLTEMYKKNSYAQMVLYIEACYSGSMFRNVLSDRIRVYATTAANHHESSWASFCESRNIGVCLADEYSHNWMADSERHDLHTWSLDDQFELVKIGTKRSHVMKYGDMSMGGRKTAEFQTHNSHETPKSTDQVTSRDRKHAHKVHLVGLAKKLMSAKSEQEHKIAQRRLHRAIEMGHIVKQVVEDIEEEIESTIKPKDGIVDEREKQDCFKSVFSTFSTKCFSIQQVPEVAQYTPLFQEFCRRGYPVKEMKGAILNTCA